MKTLRWSLVVLVLGLASLAEAQTASCPAEINLNTSPFGDCAGCTVPGNPGVFTSPVTILGNGTFGCEILNAANGARCIDPNVQRCGGILPTCSPFGTCNLNTATVCFAAYTDIPSQVDICPTLPPAMWEPDVCRCYTTIVRRPWSPEQKALAQRFVNTLTQWVATAGLAIAQLPNAPTRWVFDAMFTLFSAQKVRLLTLIVDPPDCSYLTLTSPYLPSLNGLYLVSKFTRDTSLEPDQWDKLDTWYANAQRIKQALDAAGQSMDRWSCAVQQSTPQVQQSQIDQFNIAMVVVKPLWVTQAAIQRSFLTDPRWLDRTTPYVVPSPRPNLAGFAMGVESLDAMVAADLSSQP